MFNCTKPQHYMLKDNKSDDETNENEGNVCTFALQLSWPEPRLC